MLDSTGVLGSCSKEHLCAVMEVLDMSSGVVEFGGGGVERVDEILIVTGGGVIYAIIELTISVICNHVVFSRTRG